RPVPGERRRPAGDHARPPLHRGRVPVQRVRYPVAVYHGALDRAGRPGPDERLARAAVRLHRHQPERPAGAAGLAGHRGRAATGGGAVTVIIARRDVAFPFAVDGRGRTADRGYDDHVRDMIELLLFTQPGERVMRPDFGCGLADLVFEPNSPELA